MSRWKSSGRSALLVSLLCTLPLTATTLSISDGAASFVYNDSPIAVNFSNDSFTYANSGDTLFAESWYLFISGEVRELQSGVLEVHSSTSATMNYRLNLPGSLESVSITYDIRDTGTAGVLRTKVNLVAGNAPASGTLINYFDHDLGRSFSDDTAVFDPQANQITIGAGALDSTEDVVRVGSNIDSWQIGQWPSLVNQIRNGSPLTNQNSPFGPADFTGAMGWDFSLNSGESFDLNTGGGAIGPDADDIITQVPEPENALFLAGLLAGGICGLRRRNPRLSEAARTS